VLSVASINVFDEIAGAAGMFDTGGIVKEIELSTAIIL